MILSEGKKIPTKAKGAPKLSPKGVSKTVIPICCCTSSALKIHEIARSIPLEICLPMPLNTPHTLTCIRTLLPPQQPLYCIVTTLPFLFSTSFRFAFPFPLPHPLLTRSLPPPWPPAPTPSNSIHTRHLDKCACCGRFIVLALFRLCSACRSACRSVSLCIGRLLRRERRQTARPEAP